MNRTISNLSDCPPGRRATAYLLASLYENHDGNILFVTANFDEGQSLADDLVNLIGEEPVRFFPQRQVNPMNSGRRRVKSPASVWPPGGFVVVSETDRSRPDPGVDRTDHGQRGLHDGLAPFGSGPGI